MSGLPLEYEFSHDHDSDVTAADRDDLSDRLNQAFADGHLTVADYQARLTALFAAKKRADLVPVLQGLPGQYRSTEPALAGEQIASPGQVQPLRPAPRALIVAGVGAAVVLVVLIVLLVTLL